MRETALALEASGNETGEVIAAADLACSDKKGQLADATVAEMAQRARLGVLQQRSNARKLDRRF